MASYIVCVEVREEATKARTAIALLVLAGLFGVFGVLFLLLCTLYALSYRIPLSGAALVLSAILSLGAVAAGVSGRKRLKQLRQIAPKTVESL